MILQQSDLDFLLAQNLFGAYPPVGTDPFTNEGIRNVDGTFNNLLHIATFADQYFDPALRPWLGLVNTDTFGNSNQPFIHLTTPEFRIINLGTFGSADYAQTPGDPGAVVIDSSPRVISNLIADMIATNPNLPIDDPLDPLFDPEEPPIIGNPGDEESSSCRTMPCSRCSASSWITASTSSTRAAAAPS